MVRPKQSSSKKAPKKPNRGVDFKKIKRKLGRKLPPPKNATNTEVKSKVIVLPEQSVATDRTGLALSSKGLTLRELLQQTSHHNSKIRKAALNGIRDIILKHPSELTTHKIVILEKLRERICDNDKMVRETLYNIFKTVIFPATKEDITRPIITLMMAYVFNAMTHIVVDIQLMAFRFLELIVLSFPSSFFLFADQVLENYVDILRNNKIYTEDKNKLRSILGGLNRCLALAVDSKTEETPHEAQIVDRRCLHAFDLIVCKQHSGIPSLAKKVEELVHILVNSFYEYTSLLGAMLPIDSQTFDCALFTVSIINMALKIFVHEMDDPATFFGLSELLCNRGELGNIMFSHLKKLWEAFPIEQEGSRCLILNVQIVEIYLNLINYIDHTTFSAEKVLITEKVLQFIESLLLGEVGTGSLPNGSIGKQHIPAVVPFIPALISKVEVDWSSRLLKAFTCGYKSCRMEAKLIPIYLGAIKKMLFLDHNLAPFGFVHPSVDMLAYQTAWVQELPRLLMQLGDKHPSLSKVILELLLHTGQYLLPNYSLALEYDSLQYELMEFYSIGSSIKCGPFVYLPNDCQELAISCLYYFSNLSSELLGSLTRCCLCDGLKPATLLHIVEVVDSIFKAGHLKITDYTSFLITLIIRFDVSQEFDVGEKNERISKHDFFQFLNHVGERDGVSKWDTFNSLVHTVCSCFSGIGDSSLVLKLIFNIIGDLMSLKPPVENLWGLLLVIVALVKRHGQCSVEEVILLGDWLSHFLISSTFSELSHLTLQSDKNSALQYHILPAFSLLYGKNIKLLDHVMRNFNSFILGHGLDVHGADLCTLTRRIHAVSRILMFMYHNAKLRTSLPSIEASCKVTFRSLSKLMASGDLSATITESNNVRCIFDQVKVIACKLHLWDSNNFDGV